MLAFYERNNLSAILCTLAKGTATSEMLDCFGLEVTEKTVMMSVVTNDTWEKVKRGLEDNFQIDVPGTGIAFLLPLSSVGGKKTLQFLADGQVYDKVEESVMKDTKYELIVVIANDEKEIIYIVAKTADKNAIMKSIMENAGMNSRAKSVVFSIPVTDTAGLRLQEVQ